MITSNELHRLTAHYSHPDHKVRMYGVVYQQSSQDGATAPQLDPVYTGELFVNFHTDENGMFRVWQENGAVYSVGLVDNPTAYLSPFVVSLYYTERELEQAQAQYA